MARWRLGHCMVFWPCTCLVSILTKARVKFKIVLTHCRLVHTVYPHDGATEKNHARKATCKRISAAACAFNWDTRKILLHCCNRDRGRLPCSFAAFSGTSRGSTYHHRCTYFDEQLTMSSLVSRSCSSRPGVFYTRYKRDRN